MSDPVATRDLTRERELALAHAVTLHEGLIDDTDVGKAVRATASDLFDWLIGPALMFLTLGPVVDQATGDTITQPTGGSSVQITETQQFDVTVDVRSAKGTAIPDDPNISTDDVAFEVGDPGVASVLLDPSGRRATVVAGVAGSTDLTVSLGELSARVAVDVVPGGAATLNVTTGDPVEQQA
jgi:hypothetical protein